jgi:hypothetical protein
VKLALGGWLAALPLEPSLLIWIAVPLLSPSGS